MSEEIKSVEDTLKELEKTHEKNREVILNLVEDGKLPMPRKLTRKERRALDAAKVNILKIEPKDLRSSLAIKEDLADWIIDNIYPDFDFSEVDNNVCLWFGDYIFSLAYKQDLTVKN